MFFLGGVRLYTKCFLGKQSYKNHLVLGLCEKMGSSPAPLPASLLPRLGWLQPEAGRVYLG